MPKSCRSLIESLERRRLLASTFAETSALAEAADRSVAGGFSATINFQPESLGSVDNTRADFGRPFGVRGNGLSYGWSRDLEAAGDVVDRDTTRDLYSLTESRAVGNGPASERQDIDERYDTVALPEPGDTWSIDVPDGRTYALAVVVGDPDFGDPGAGGPVESETFIDVNGERFIRAELRAYWPYAEVVGYVEPGPDGRITLDFNARNVEARLLWVRVTEVEPLPTYETGEPINWQQIGGVPATDINVPTSPVVRAEGGAVRLGDEFFFFGGYTQAYVDVHDQIDRLDLTDGTRQEEVRTLPDGVSETHATFAADEARGLIYMAGGQLGITPDTAPQDIRDEVYAFDPNAGNGGVFTQLPDLPEGRTAAISFVHGDRLHVLGGGNELGVLTQVTHWSLDLVDAVDNGNSEAEWEVMPPLPFAVNHSAVHVVPGAAPSGGDLAVVVMGEYDHNFGYSGRQQIQRYDFDAASWSLGQLSPVPLSHINTAFDGERIWSVGGQRRGNFVGDDVFSYDVAEDRWRIHTSAAQPRKVGSLVYDDEEDRLLYIAGDSRDEGFMSDALVGEIDRS